MAADFTYCELATCIHFKSTAAISPIEEWLSHIPNGVDSEAIIAVLKSHFPELFV